MHNLKTATKFFPLTSRNIRITFYNEQKISKPPKNPWESPSCFSTPFHLRTHTSPPLPSPPPQSKHGFVPRSLARFQAANKQRNNSARRGGWFLETRKRRVGVARPVTSSFVAAMTPESLESTRPFGQPFTLTRMIAFQSSILCVPFRKKGYASSFYYSNNEWKLWKAKLSYRVLSDSVWFVAIFRYFRRENFTAKIAIDFSCEAVSCFTVEFIGLNTVFIER